MRMYERVKWRERKNTKKEQRKGRGSKQAFIFWAPTCPPLFSPSPFFHLFCLSGCVLSPCLVDLKLISFFFLLSLSVKKHLYPNHFLNPRSLCIPSFLQHFPPCLSIILTVKTLSALRHKHFVSVCASLPSTIISPFHLSFSLGSNNQIILQNPQSLSKHAPASYKRKNKSRCRLAHKHVP